MAETSTNNSNQPPVAADAAGAKKNEFTAADAVKAFSKKSITVRVPKTGKDGSPLRTQNPKGKDGGLYQTAECALAPEHVISHRKERGVVTIITQDGARYRSNEAAE